MSKRNFEMAFPPEGKSQKLKKHTLDSDEEDEVEDNVLNESDIEGEEDGIDRQEGEQKITAFNMNEEMEEGHFDKQGHFIWNNEKEVRDNWLDNIDWQKVKASDNKQKYNVDEQGLGAGSDSESEEDEIFDEFKSYKSILEYLKPKETINKALKRLGGADMKLSSVERLKRKKAGTLSENKDIIDLTEFANKILTKLGNMNVYQETYEEIKTKVETNENKNKSRVVEPKLDMYADDFVENLQKFGESSNSKDKSNDNQTPVALMWEFKWKIEDEEIHGPYTTSQMVKWSKEKYFKTGVMVRKCEEGSNFHTSNRIDFELYE